jgi:flagellar motor switch protein FliM
MAEVLSQNEIEALLASLATEEGPQTPSEHAGGGPGPPGSMPPRASQRAIAYEVYDFRRPDKFSKEQLRTLQITHETFARMLASSLSGYLRTMVHVDLVSVEQVPYDEYMRFLSSSILNVFTIEPLDGQAILEIDFGIVFSLMDRLLGGPGTPTKQAEELTEIERSLVHTLVDRALAEWKSAWSEVAEMNPVRQLTETNPQFVQVVPPSDTVLSVLFEIRVGETRGAMSLCIPYVYLKPAIANVSGQRWFAPTPQAPDDRVRRSISTKVRTTRIPCIVELGRAQLTVRDVLGMEPGDIIRLDRKARQPVDLMIGNRVKFRVSPGTLGKKLAVQVVSPVYGES